MARLIASEAWPGLPERAGRLRLSTPAEVPVAQILPFRGQDVSDELRQKAGVGFPAPGRSEAAGERRIVWSGRDEALLLGPSVSLEGAACIDQSDGWAALEIGGEVRSTLARLCPLDLRERMFPEGQTARTLLNHVAVSLTRTGSEAWLLLVPRSMAGTVLDELVEAARGVAARG